MAVVPNLGSMGDPRTAVGGPQDLKFVLRSMGGGSMEC